MESKLKSECMDQSGELYENLLLREFGYPHLPNPVFVPEPKTKQAIVGLLENKSDAWNDAGTKPDHPCLCETKLEGCENSYFQYFNGEFFGFACGAADQAIKWAHLTEPNVKIIQWREVQS